jgi:hypothetical protein
MFLPISPRPPSGTILRRGLAMAAGHTGRIIAMDD